MGHKYATVVHQGSSSREESVGSWASRSSQGYQSSSRCSSEASHVFEREYRDPSSRDNVKKSTERPSKKRGSVVVVNHHKGSKETGPTPTYSGGYSRV